MTRLTNTDVKLEGGSSKDVDVETETGESESNDADKLDCKRAGKLKNEPRVTEKRPSNTCTIGEISRPEPATETKGPMTSDVFE